MFIKLLARILNSSRECEKDFQFWIWTQIYLEANQPDPGPHVFISFTAGSGTV